MSAPRETVPLEVFLAELDPEAATAARTAAARMDALERQVGPPSWLERNLISLGLIALALFVAGAGALIGILPWLRSVIGLGGITALVMLFPGLMVAYLVSVRGRTAIDNEKMALNDRHFIPHGGFYFAAPRDGGTAMVVRVDRPEKHEPTLRDKVQAQYDSATKRRW